MVAVIRKNREGVVLDYGDPGAAHRHHADYKHHPDDPQRLALIAAEREVLTLRVIAEHAEFSEIAMTRITDALNIIQRALELKRPDVGLSRPRVWS
jgi:hypothetical protein